MCLTYAGYFLKSVDQYNILNAFVSGMFVCLSPSVETMSH